MLTEERKDYLRMFDRMDVFKAIDGRIGPTIQFQQYMAMIRIDNYHFNVPMLERLKDIHEYILSDDIGIRVVDK